MKITSTKIQKYQQTSRSVHTTHTHGPTHTHPNSCLTLLKITNKKDNLKSSQRKYHIKRKAKVEDLHYLNFQDSV